jgi:hypothetical protein
MHRQRIVSASRHGGHVTEDEQLIRRLVAGDTEGLHRALGTPSAGDRPVRLVVAALVSDDPHPLLVQANRAARTTRDRQLVAIVTAHVDGDRSRLDVLVRDHLVDHPDSLLAAWIATEQAGVTGPDTQE